MIASALALVLALVVAPVQDPGTGTIRGTVRTESTGAPLAGAAVEVVGAAGRRVVATDDAGRYLILGVPGGPRLLRAAHLGHEPLEVEVVVAPGGELNVDFSLRFRPVPISGVTARGQTVGTGGDTAAASLPELGIAGVRVMESAPGIVELGMGGESRGPPGQAPVDPSDVLFVRGVASDLKLVLLDGAPVYSPFHVGGLLDSFDAHVLRDATLYLGGAPARYDGGLSYILDLTTRSARTDRVHSTGAVDMMSARMTAEGGFGDRLRILAGGRGVHGYGIEPLLRGAVPYAYGEALGRVDVGLSDRHSLGLTAFHNREGVSLDSLGDGHEAGWGNTALSLRLRGPVGGTESELTAAYGAFDASLPAVDGESFPARGEARRLRLAADFAQDAGPLRLRFGASYDRQQLAHEVHSRPGELPRTWDGDARGESAGAYVESAWQPATRLRLRAGLRVNAFFEDPGLRLAPRFSATWMLSDRASLTAAAGQYHQYVRTVDAPRRVRVEDVPDTLFLPTGLAVDRATHFNLALHQDLDDGLRLGVEGFYKTFDGAGLPQSGRTQASGVDLWVRRDAGRLRGWLGYSLNWVWSMPREQTTSEEFAGRQMLNAGVMGPLGRWVDVEVRVAYGAGLPFSSIPVAPNDAGTEPVMSAPQAPIYLGTNTRQAADAPLAPEYPADPYLRLDVGLSRTFETRWGRTPLEISPYLKVLNSLDRRDALFYWSDRDSDTAPRAVAALPLLPVVGVSWRF